METRSLAAVSCAETRLLADLMRRKRRLESSGWTVPRREARLKPRRWGVVVVWVLLPWEWLEVLLLRFEERMERARFLGKEVSVPLRMDGMVVWRDVKCYTTYGVRCGRVTTV